MGIDVYEARFLIECRRRGANFNRSAMLGRQRLCLTPRSFRYLLRRFDILLDENLQEQVLARTEEMEFPFAEKFFEFLGAKSIVSIDNSDYEGASIITALEAELPNGLANSFSSVVDCGTLEHIFDVSAALSNSMRLVEPGGHYIAVLPCNNNMGHGFYQFSPELFYNILVPENGFDLEVMYFMQRSGKPTFWKVPDPNELGVRVEFDSEKSGYLLLLARRIGDIPSSRLEAFQSDYVSAWERKDHTLELPMHEKIAFRLKHSLPPGMYEAIRSIYYRLAGNDSFRSLDRVPW